MTMTTATKPLTIEDLQMLRRWMPIAEYQTIRDNFRGEEGNFFKAKMAELAEIIRTMPKTYEQDGKGMDAVAYLHYFTAGADWWITERDQEEVQYQAFGLADLFGDGGELGCISIVELIQAIEPGAELDLYWTPKTLAAIRTEKGR